MSGVSASAASIAPGAVTARKHRREAARKMNPLPLIQVAMQLPEGSKRICRTFEVGGFLGLRLLHMPVGLVLIHGRGL
jgi:hypothetical protein